jgi:hypothetical protein
MRHRIGFASAFAIAAIVAGPVFAQQVRAPAAAQQLSRPDMNFMKEAAGGGMAEVDSGNWRSRTGRATKSNSSAPAWSRITARPATS